MEMKFVATEGKIFSLQRGLTSFGDCPLPPPEELENYEEGVVRPHWLIFLGR